LPKAPEEIQRLQQQIDMQFRAKFEEAVNKELSLFNLTEGKL